MPFSLLHIWREWEEEKSFIFLYQNHILPNVWSLLWLGGNSAKLWDVTAFAYVSKEALESLRAQIENCPVWGATIGLDQCPVEPQRCCYPIILRLVESVGSNSSLGDLCHGLQPSTMWRWGSPEKQRSWDLFHSSQKVGLLPYWYWRVENLAKEDNY
jgi:hypothetical protein